MYRPAATVFEDVVEEDGYLERMVAFDVRWQNLSLDQCHQCCLDLSSLS